jgi:hypothetical protein
LGSLGCQVGDNEFRCDAADIEHMLRVRAIHHDQQDLRRRQLRDQGRR